MTKLQRARMKRQPKMTLRDLADRTGYSAATLCRIENGQYTAPMDLARRLCRIFADDGITMAYLARLGRKK